MAKRDANDPSARANPRFDPLYRGKPRRIGALKRDAAETSSGPTNSPAPRIARPLASAARPRAAHASPAISRIEAADYDGRSLRILRKIAAYLDQELIVTFKPQRRGATVMTE